MFFFQLSRTLTGIFWYVNRKIFDNVFKTAFYVSKGAFCGKIYFSEKSSCFLSFLDVEEEISRLLAKIFQQGYRNRILLVQRNILRRKNTFRKNVYFYLFGHWAESCGLLIEKNLRKNIIFEEFFLIFSDCEQKLFSPSGGNFPDG